MLVSVYLYLQNKSRVTSLQNCIQILFLIYKHVDVTNQPKKPSSKCEYKSNFLTKKNSWSQLVWFGGKRHKQIGGSGRSAAVSSQLRNKYLLKQLIYLILAFSSFFYSLGTRNFKDIFPLWKRFIWYTQNKIIDFSFNFLFVCHVLINLNLAKLFGHLCWVIWRLFTS